MDEARHADRDQVMKTAHIDYVVVGESLAGISAALELAHSGHRVLLLDFHRDTDRVADLPRVRGTALGARATGTAFAETAGETMARARIDRQTFCPVTSIHSEGIALVECSDRRWSCKGVVFAPNGTEPGLLGSSRFHGFGVSYSAASDAHFFISRRVAVYGDSPRVIEHAWIAAEYASEVIVLLKHGADEADVELLTELRSSSSITFVTFIESTAVRALRVADNGMLRAVEIESASGRRSIDTPALFVAQHLSPMIDVVHKHTGDGKIALAGLAAGIDYWKHAALVDDGVRAARQLLKTLE